MDLTKAKLWFVALSMIAMILFGISVQRESDQEWRKYQTQYFDMERARGVQEDYTVKIRQIWIPALNRTDRCITCHVGMQDSDVSNPYTQNPFKSHPNIAMLKMHPIDKMGCTICHEGQGMATTMDDAHGHVASWDYPMHEKVGGIDTIESSCTKCHAYNALPVGTEVLVAGAALAKQDGCFGCHTSKEVAPAGGTQCPELTGEGSKSEGAFASTHSFEFVKDRLENGDFLTKFEWLFQHFVNAKKITPAVPSVGQAETAMPDFEMNDTQAAIMTTYVESFHNPEVENLPSSWMAKGTGKYSIIDKDFSEPTAPAAK